MGDFFSGAMSAAAAAEASEAAREARSARAASEERLESSGHNPFISFERAYLDNVKGEGLLSFLGVGSKAKLTPGNKTYSIKKTDISHLSGGTDDFGSTYTKVHLEDRCNLDFSSFVVIGNLEQVQNYINSK